MPYCWSRRAIGPQGVSFGFSFVVLRLSTLLLAWTGLLAFCGTLRELGTRPLLAALGTLMLWCNPVFFVLSHSFMTDVPFVRARNAALFCYMRWIKRGHTRDLGLGSVATLSAFPIRQPGKGVIMVCVVGVLLWGTVAVTGTVDQWRYHQTVNETRDWLLRQGVSAEHIDAGYALTGWWLYAHAPPGMPTSLDSKRLDLGAVVDQQM
jgi:dolichyl-phosphate-mannose--protein O-mannosyl transferase